MWTDLMFYRLLILLKRMIGHLFFIGTVYGLLSGTPSNMHVYQITGMTVTNDFDIPYKVAQVEKEKENEKVIVDKY